MDNIVFHVNRCFRIRTGYQRVYGLLSFLVLLSSNRPRSDAELPRLNSDLGTREEKYPRSEFSLGNSASDLGL
ncbi:hypothetical protein OUZ56_010735 [Daphnia magna]|uniref:Uncharacterized protein n=1 Tax=Daphnia magna TaxID=35525 RepID=A0ABQ9YYF7_9CRUS|nr:hypothetical protein OUZ56_010735 [Daphnia magna]